VNTAIASTGAVTGSGTTNKIALFTASGTIGDSLLSQDAGATTVTVAGNLGVTTGKIFTVGGGASYQVTVGSGTFTLAGSPSAGNGPYSVIVQDFNGDGKVDLAVADWGGNTISVQLGNGDGTFQAQTTYATGSHPVSVAAGDLNGDGKVDLVA